MNVKDAFKKTLIDLNVDISEICRKINSVFSIVSFFVIIIASSLFFIQLAVISHCDFSELSCRSGFFDYLNAYKSIRELWMKPVEPVFGMSTYFILSIFFHVIWGAILFIMILGVTLIILGLISILFNVIKDLIPKFFVFCFDVLMFIFSFTKIFLINLFK